MSYGSILPQISVADLARAMRADKLIFFVGAGVSFATPSNLPGFLQLQNDMIKVLHEGLDSDVCHLYDEVWAQLNDGSAPTAIAQKFMNVAPELLFEMCRRNIQCITKNDEHFELVPLLEFSKATPNRNHLVLAELLATRAIAAIVTTNVDVLLEQATAYSNRERSTLSVVTVCQGAPKSHYLEADQPILIKLHGSIDSADSIIVSLRDVGRQCARGTLRPLKALFESHVVVFSGYRGADLDVFACLVGSTPRGIIWNARTPESILPKIANVLGRLNAKVLLGDLNTLFRQLARLLNIRIVTPEHSRSAGTNGPLLVDRLKAWAQDIEPFARLLILGDLWEFVGEYSTCCKCYLVGRAWVSKRNRPELECIFYNRLAGLEFRRGRYAEAQLTCSDWLGAAEQLPGALRLSNYRDISEMLGLIESKQDIAKATRRYAEALRYQQELEDVDQKSRLHRADILSNLGNVLALGKLTDDAIQQYWSALHIYDEFGDVLGRGRALSNIANIWLDRGNYSECIDLGREAEYLFRETGDISSLATIAKNLAVAHYSQGNQAEAELWALQSLAWCEALDDKRRVVESSQFLHSVRSAQHRRKMLR